MLLMTDVYMWFYIFLYFCYLQYVTVVLFLFSTVFTVHVKGSFHVKVAI